MKEYIKTLMIGVLSGAVIMQLTNMAVQSWLDHPFAIGGEILLPALIGLIGYVGWSLANSYFKATKYKKTYSKGYSKGYNEGSQVHTHIFIFPVEGSNENKM